VAAWRWMDVVAGVDGGVDSPQVLGPSP
jgi:hypothetical protein